MGCKRLNTDFSNVLEIVCSEKRGYGGKKCVNYYPFGLQHSGYNSVVNGTENNYQTYNGKELEEDLDKNTLAYGWRDYDPAIGRFNKIDRFAEKYYNLSTYSYAGNNPVVFVDVQGDSIASGASTRKANRIERRAERRANRLQKKAEKKMRNYEYVGEDLERIAELRKTAQDVRDMRSDENNMYRFKNVKSKEAKDNNIIGPSSVSTGTTENGLNEITLYTENDMGNMIHETRHGGQHSRGEIDIVTQSSSLDAEVSAYRAQYSWNGNLQYMTHNFDQTTLMNRNLLNSRIVVPGTIVDINSIYDININTVLDMGEFIDSQIGTYVLPIYSPN